jgi:hypothetical protein
MCVQVQRQEPDLPNELVWYNYNKTNPSKKEWVCEAFSVEQLDPPILHNGSTACEYGAVRLKL